MDKTSVKYWRLCIYTALAVVVLAVFWQVRNYDFITTFDDDLYVVDNDHVKAGLTRDSIIWAFTKAHAHNWHPLTWISHMLDCEFCGLDAGCHHFTNVLFHTANTLLLLLVLSRLTGNFWPCVFVAAAFALHPMHVESVAWISERKDVLGAFFWILTMGAYVRYVERPGIRRYIVVFLIFALGLMTKQMLVTLPLVLLLLDYWPLGRLTFKWQRSYKSAGTFFSVRRCIWEKLPLLILSVVASATVYLVQQRTGTVRPFAEYPLFLRIGNAFVAYIKYIEKMFWPSNLAIFYPHPGSDLPLWQIIGAALLLVCITAVVFWRARRSPYLVVGWLWYLITLVPVIGLVQVGMQGLADRYTYISFIGLFIIIAWGVTDFSASLRYRKIILSLSATVLFFAIGVTTWYQIGYWRNGMTLYTHAAAVVRNNWWAYHHLAEMFVRQNKPDEAIEQLTIALQIKPDFADAHNNLGTIFAKQNKLKLAVKHFTDALRISPDFVEAHNNLGRVLARNKENDKAVEHYTISLKLNPNQPEVHYDLANVLMEEGKLNEAVEHYNKALKFRPNYLEARSNLAKALAKQGKLKEAIENWQQLIRINPGEVVLHSNLGMSYCLLGQFDKAIMHWEEALRLEPDYISVLSKLAWLLATCENQNYRSASRAVELAERACKLTAYKEPKLLDVLAAAYAEAGRFDEAVETAERALELAKLSGARQLTVNIGNRLELYKQGQAYRESSNRETEANN